MERIDQEGHQLPKKGQTMSRMPSASPLFTDTNDIGSLRWRGESVEGRSGLWLGQRKKKTNCSLREMSTWLIQNHDTVILASTRELHKWID